VLPTLLFASLGGMTWAVRGCSGFGAVAGCVFAGVTWGAAWWFVAQSPDGERRRRYDSGWIVPALTIGVGLSGDRGRMQWPHFFDGRLMTDAGRGAFVPIPRAYGFLWMFLAGVPWAGLGACLLAWCGSLRTTRWWHWALRVACHAYGLMWLVLVVQHVIGQLVTGPPTDWNEVAFSLYYLLLFLLSGTIVFHAQALRERPI
jgi:hypothetical protein